MGKDHKQKFKKNSKKESCNKHENNKDKNLFWTGSSKKSSDYENVSQHIINNIKKECVRVNDVSDDLRNLSWPDIKMGIDINHIK